MKRYVKAILASAAAVTLALPAYASHSWGTFHWARTANPLKLTVNASITPAWQASFDTAVADWDKSKKLNLTAKAVTADPKRCQPIAGQVLVCNAAYGFRGWLGIAQIWLESNRSDHISQAITKLNDSYYNLPTYNTPAWRDLVMCQEIGHDFGLDHQDEAFDNANLGTCMDYTSNPDGPPDNRHPNRHDYEQLDAIYGHLDTIDTASASTTNFGIRDFSRPQTQNAGSGDGPEDWGTAIRQDSRGRPDLFEKQLGGGRKLVTHVFWALEN